MPKKDICFADQSMKVWVIGLVHSKPFIGRLAFPAFTAKHASVHFPNSDFVASVMSNIKCFVPDDDVRVFYNADKSRFCDDVGAYLQLEMKDRDNKSVIVLGNYEDLEHRLFSTITHNLDGKLRWMAERTFWTWSKL